MWFKLVQSNWQGLCSFSCKQLQHRRREAHQTEQALWLWSLTLQAKVMPAFTFLTSNQSEARSALQKLASHCWSCLDSALNSAGVVWVEAMGCRATQQARAGIQSGSGLQRPAAEGGRVVHPHICSAHEWAHNEPNAVQPGTSGWLCVFVLIFYICVSSAGLLVSCRERSVSRESLNVAPWGGSSGCCADDEKSRRSDSLRKAWPSVWPSLLLAASPRLAQRSREMTLQADSECVWSNVQAVKLKHTNYRDNSVDF